MKSDNRELNLVYIMSRYRDRHKAAYGASPRPTNGQSLMLLGNVAMSGYLAIPALGE